LLSPKTVFAPHHDYQKIAQTPKNGPKTRSKVKVRIKGYIENGSFSTLRIDPKIYFEPYCNPKNGPRKLKRPKN